MIINWIFDFLILSGPAFLFNRTVKQQVVEILHHGKHQDQFQILSYFIHYLYKLWFYYMFHISCDVPLE